MKNAGIDTTPAETEQLAAPAGPHGDGRTRHAVARLLLERGPIAASAVADELGLSPAAVRRHLDVLLADGQAFTRDAPRRGHRGRGRPAKLFLLTEAGRARFGHAYDDLAVAALRFVAEQDGGDELVQRFIDRRVHDLVDRHRSTITAKPDPADRAQALAEALTREGYAASARHVLAGEQLCQHHCPVAHVAAEFPQLCEAETAAFAELLGTHVQRLATIARGDAVCTTHVPHLVRADGDPTAPPQPVTAQAAPATPPAAPATATPNGGEPA